MTQSVLESMARAIEPLIRQAQPIYGWDETEIARAALIALRDGVTPGMIQAAHMADPGGCDVEWAETIYPPSFIAMIDHVLQEGEKTVDR